MQISATSRTSSKAVQIDKIPDTCPLCNHGVVPIPSGAVFSTGSSVEVVLRCPRENCERFFIARYQLVTMSGTYFFRGCAPIAFLPPQFAQLIRDISADFVEIYQQAEAAEKHGLALVCGPGYRKALEFLIKDYVIRLHPDQTEAIKKMQLGPCISKYVLNERIVTVASRAAWLGNDETHYQRKWENKDLQDLKNLIGLTVRWIEMEEITKAITTDMPDPKAAAVPAK